MTTLDPAVTAIATALGVGLLVGIERERNKGAGAGRAPGGVRTFALAALAGVLSALAGEVWLVIAGLLAVTAFGVAGYVRDRGEDPGLTTEIALVVTFLLGALAAARPALAAGVGVVATVVLASRTRLHGWIRDGLTERELHDGLVLAAAALVVLPLLPDRAIDPWGVLNPRVLWWLAVLVMAINGAGYVALRAAGPRYGLPVAGLAAGFVSSTATHGAMGSRARAEPALLGAAAAGASLSSVATVVQLLGVLAVANVAVLRAMVVPMALAGLAAVAWGVVNMRRALHGATPSDVAPGRAFDLRTALVFTGTVAVVLVLGAVLTDTLGAAGGLFGVIVAGLADAHAAAVSGATLVASGRLDLSPGVMAILGAFSVNAGAKLIVAYTTGGTAFGHRVLPGLVLMVAMAWLGAWLVPA